MFASTRAPRTTTWRTNLTENNKNNNNKNSTQRQWNQLENKARDSIKLRKKIIDLMRPQRKKQKQQLEEMNRLEQAASRNLEKQRKQAIETNWLEHVVKKRSQLTTNRVIQSINQCKQVASKKWKTKETRASTSNGNKLT